LGLLGKSLLRIHEVNKMMYGGYQYLQMAKLGDSYRIAMGLKPVAMEKATIKF
jgi:hypothetical protein